MCAEDKENLIDPEPIIEEGQRIMDELGMIPPDTEKENDQDE